MRTSSSGAGGWIKFFTKLDRYRYKVDKYHRGTFTEKIRTIALK